ncbi:S-layer homology domain-containing protein [Paenibacillus sp. H1-7]|uniref:S-layer homology domain-containing protein n=1 Tax=Paenibacillus sp. H1-7 TaxID=2282849 RepID=UPI001EF7F546|nr:S-layer homology domain-containing protein [Paenibacillus sp. H1-7]ULL16365.1 S-layer homology domain-containing protein [Paenibacillus sp. H1-7]
MKNFFSAVLSLSMAFSMLPVAALAADAPKDSTAFSDLKDLDAATKAKYDDMLKAGIFNGIEEGKFGLKEKMNRAQFAKVAALVFQLKTDASLKKSTFQDVTSDDPSNGYALPFIEAIYKAGITDGYAEGLFNPSGEVTKEQLAAFLVKGLKLDEKVKASAGVKDDTVSDWAKGYVAVAIDLKLMVNGANGKFDGTTPATRDLLVLSAYEAKKQLASAAKPEVVTKVSINKAEVTGAKTIKVTLNGAIADTSKLTVGVTRGSTKIEAKPKWNDNKNEVELTLDAKMTEGVYNVKLEAVKDGGLTVDKGSADVTAQTEKLTKLEFTTASDTIALGKEVVIAFRALNQYNEQTDLPAARFDIRVNSDLTVKASNVEQSFTINTSDLERNDVISVTVLTPEKTVQANKTFKIGDKQLVSKVELGELKLISGKKKLEAGDKAYLDYKAYDQYGMLVTELDLLRDQTNLLVSDADAILDGTITENGIKIDKGFGFFEDEDSDNRPDLIIRTASANPDMLPGEHEVTFSVMPSSGQTATKKVQIVSSDVPFDISFGKPSAASIAWGDEDVYLPVIVKDKNGKELSVDDIVRFANEIRIDDSGSARVKISRSIETEGVGRGKIKIGGLEGTRENDEKAGTLTITATIEKNNKSATYSTWIGEKRYPNQVYVSSEPKPLMVPSLTPLYVSTDNMITENKMKLKFKDQYGDDFDKDYTGYEVDISYEQISGTVTNAVYFTKGSLTSTTAPTWQWDTDKASPNHKITFVGDDTRADGYSASKTSVKSIRDADLTFTPITGDDNVGEYKMTATLFKMDGKSRNQMSSVSREVELLNSKDAEKVTYEVKAFANGLFATNDLYLGAFEAGSVASDLSKLALPGLVAPTSEADAMANWFAGKIEVSAKNSKGENVGLPNNLIQGVSTTNKFAVPVARPKSDSLAFDTIALRGVEEGTTNVAVTFRNGHKPYNLSNVQVKKDALNVASFTLAENGKSKTVWLSLLNNLSIHSGDSVANGVTQLKKTLGDIKLKDQYGAFEFKNYSVYRAADLFGTRFSINNAKWSDPANPGTIEIVVDKKAGTAVYKYVPGAGGSQIVSFTVMATSGSITQTVDVFTDRTK